MTIPRAIPIDEVETMVATVRGFNQDASEMTGIEGTRDHLAEHFHNLLHVSFDRPVNWDHDMEGYAAYLARHNYERLVILAYSWGMGYGAMHLVQEAIKQGIEVALVLSCDGVFRRLSMPVNKIGTFFSIRSLSPWAAIQVPDEVGRVAGVRQNRNRPAGHPIKHHGAKVPLDHIKRKDVRHNNIDESREWMDLTIDELEALFLTPA
jgi:hypothetical protein